MLRCCKLGTPHKVAWCYVSANTGLLSSGCATWRKTRTPSLLATFYVAENRGPLSLLLGAKCSGKISWCYVAENQGPSLLAWYYAAAN